MATNTQDLEIEDADDYVDKQLKQRLIARRNDVAEWEKELLYQAHSGQHDIEYESAISLWGDRVRAYLLAIEPVLRTTGGETPFHEGGEPALPGAEETYLERPIGAVTISVPEPWGQMTPGVWHDGVRIHGDAPGAKTVNIQGLKDVIERQHVEATWSIDIERELTERGQARYETIVETNATYIPRTALRNAVRVADQWLQDVGIGMQIDTAGLPSIDGFDQSREGEDRGDLGFDDASDAPDL